MGDGVFRSLTSPPRLPAEGEIHVWATSLAVSAARRADLRVHLSPAEAKRAARYRIAGPRERFVVARGLLREILGGYLGVSPVRLRFDQNAWDKPKLAECAMPLHFNVAHSAALVLYAVVMDRPVGIDVEKIRPVEHVDRLVARYFSPAERAAFGGLRSSPRQKLTAFFATWVRKEAYMKARGEGFALPLSAFDVTVAPDDPPQLLADRHHPDDWARWTLHDLPIASGYRASLAVRGDIGGVFIRESAPASEWGD